MRITATVRQTVLIIATLVAFAYLATRALLKGAHLHVNLTDSVPVGLYRETSDRSGDYAGFCLALSDLRAAQKAGLHLNRGSCAGGVAPILKPFVQSSLQRPLTYTDRGFQIAGKLLPNTTPKTVSRRGKPLAHYPFGTYTEGLWLISSYNQDSFDSRYFGPVDPIAIRFYATPLLTAE